MPKTKAVLAMIILIIILLTAAVIYRNQILNFFAGRPSREEIFNKVQKIQNLALAQKNCQEAVSEANRFLKRAPDAAEVWHWKGICEFESGDLGEAKKSFEKVLALEPEHGAAKNYLNILSEVGVK